MKINFVIAIFPPKVDILCDKYFIPYFIMKNVIGRSQKIILTVLPKEIYFTDIFQLVLMCG